MAANKDKGIKPGWKSTEWILSLVTSICALAIAGGFVDPEGTTNVDKIAAFICSALAAVGYSVSRATVKKAEIENK